jgi:hypothetical protein
MNYRFSYRVQQIESDFMYQAKSVTIVTLMLYVLLGNNNSATVDNLSVPNRFKTEIVYLLQCFKIITSIKQEISNKLMVIDQLLPDEGLP